MKSKLSHQIIKINNINLHITEAGPADGPLIILLHGFPDTWYCWRYQIDLLVEKGYHVILPDQRGYNKSEKPQAIADYSLDHLSNDIIEIIKYYNWQNAILMGHDWGGCVAWYTALRFPKFIKSLLICNMPHPKVMQTELKKSPLQLLKSWYIFFFQIPFIPEFSLKLGNFFTFRHNLKLKKYTQEEQQKYLQAWRQPGALKAMINWYRASLRYPPQKMKSSRLSLPVIMIWGEKDPYLGVNLAKKSIDFCENGELHLIKNAGHWVHLEESEKANQLIDRFL